MRFRFPNPYCWFIGHQWIWQTTRGLAARRCKRCNEISPGLRGQQ